MFLFTLVLTAASSEVSTKLPTKIGYAELNSILSHPSSNVLLLDVRTKEEFQAGHIKGALLFPFDQLSASFAEKNKYRPIIVYCHSGRRSAIAMNTLVGMGYRQVSDFGGIGSWKGILITGD